MPQMVTITATYLVESATADQARKIGDDIAEGLLEPSVFHCGDVTHCGPIPEGGFVSMSSTVVDVEEVTDEDVLDRITDQ